MSSRQFTEQHKLNMSLSMKGRTPWNKGKTNVYSKQTLDKISESLRGKKNWNWKENVSYNRLHDWVREEKGKAQECENCNTSQSPRFEWANLSGEYKKDLDDFVSLCVNCHHLIDNSAGYSKKKIKTTGVQ
jgi:hypothetical protein